MAGNGIQAIRRLQFQDGLRLTYRMFGRLHPAQTILESSARQMWAEAISHKIKTKLCALSGLGRGKVPNIDPRFYPLISKR